MAVILVWASPALRSSSKGQRHGRYGQGHRYPRGAGDAPDGELQDRHQGDNGGHHNNNGVLQVACMRHTDKDKSRTIMYNL